MIVKVETWVYLDVTGEAQAEEACHSLTSLDGMLNLANFPDGEAIDVEVDHYEVVTPEEVAERGLDE